MVGAVSGKRPERIYFFCHWTVLEGRQFATWGLIQTVYTKKELNLLQCSKQKKTALAKLEVLKTK